MSKQVSAKELAEIVTRLLTDTEGSGELDDPGVFQGFMTAIAEVVCDFCGGEVRNPADQFEDVWYVGIHGNDSLPDAFGGIWREYDKEGELFEEAIAESSAEALAQSGVTDYCNQVCGGGNCGTGEVCQYGIDHQTHMPPTTRNVFVELLDAKAITVEASDAVVGADGVEIRRDLVAADSRWAVALLRYFNPVGAHESGLIGEDPQGTPNNLMPYITQVAVGQRESLQVFGGDYPTPDGTGVRDYIHVVDLAKGHIKALQALDEPRLLTVNLGTGQGYSVLEMVAALARASGREIPYQIVARRAGDVAACYADPSLALQLLDWRAELGLERMCADSWRWQSQNPQGYS